MQKTFLQKIFSLIICCFFVHQINAQNYTGTWEGITDGDEFLQLNIIQVGTTICGFSWDYESYNKRSFCKANFNGYLNKERKVCFVEGMSFIQNSGSHALMNIKFSLVYENGEPRLQGACQIKASMISGAGPASYFLLKKISKKPTVVTDGMKLCLPPEKEPIAKIKSPKVITTKKPVTVRKPIATVKTPVKKTTTKPVTKVPPVKPAIKPIVKAPPIIKKIDTSKITKPEVVVVKKPTPKIVEVPKITNGRTNNEQSRITLTEKKINLSIYDNGTVDGDTVSVYFDNKLVVNKKRLTGNAISLNLELDESISLHTLVVYAENLGSIPPNTALVILTTASGKRYELKSSATLEKNAALVFEYKPK